MGCYGLGMNKCAAMSLPLLVALSGCVPSGDYPSLARRTFETAAPEAVPAPPPVIAADAPLLARIAAARTLASNGKAGFEVAMAKARSDVNAAAGTARASERWIAAQLSLSRVEPLLEPAATALANLDAEKRGLMMSSPNAPELAALDEAIAIVAPLATAQRAALVAAGARLSR